MRYTVAVVRTWAIVIGSVLAVGLLAGTALPLPPKPWTKGSVRKRLQQRRPLLLTYTGLLVVAALVLVVWVLPPLLTEHPHIPKSADRHQAITNTRTGLALTLTALGAAGGLAFTARTYRLGQETYRLNREGHITDRYSKAVEQLGDEKIEVRLGGIYALERLMHDSPADQPTIMEALAAFVRQHAPHSPRPALPARGSQAPAPGHPAEDVQAVLTVLGRRDPVEDERPIDLSGANLTGATLNRADLTDATLDEAKLTDADLDGANLTGATLAGADLTDADLDEAKLTDPRLAGADLTGARLFGADLTGATFAGANLTGAHLNRADLTGAHLDRADLTGAWLAGANLTGATLAGANVTDANLFGANLTDANLFGANLTGARLFGANLTGAWLAGANLTGAWLAGANLTGAWLDEANLTDGSLDEEQLASAQGTDKITWAPPSA
ncbi:pentapeptide repeat-containing protein [Geodermatophilus sp. URMC 62]|uniref:pentapeptide repeat-containing protein n=1 Tax=Geodermatophilus sp. URMC 62 TaxID=3423414 RepID=UPI00406C04D1